MTPDIIGTICKPTGNTLKDEATFREHFPEPEH